MMKTDVAFLSRSDFRRASIVIKFPETPKMVKVIQQVAAKCSKDGGYVWNNVSSSVEFWEKFTSTWLDNIVFSDNSVVAILPKLNWIIIINSSSLSDDDKLSLLF